MYQFSPRVNKMPAYGLVFILLFTGIFLFVPIPVGDDILLWLRTGGVWAFACAFMISDRYLLTSYTYIIEKSADGGCDLVVSELHFKRIRTVCRVSVFSVAQVARNEKGKKFKIHRGMRKFNYRAELFDENYYILRIDEDGGSAFIKFSPDDKLISLICELSGHKKIDKGQ